MTGYKIIDGKQYWRVHYSLRKGNAQVNARGYRRDGRSARVLKNPETSGWDVWLRRGK